MPASQLKRLKQSLRDSGVTGPQRSKKQKKQIASSKDTTRRNDRAATLQTIRDSFNPFELKPTHSRPTKFEHASASNGSGKYKAVLHRPGVSKSAGEEMRRATLLPEMRRRAKVGGLVDRRIGEGDADMTPEERAAARFAAEKERKMKGRSTFDLEGDDDEDGGSGFRLTHGGKGVGDLAADDFDMSVSGGSDDEGNDGGLFRKKRRRSDVDEEEHVMDGEAEEQGTDEPERKKTKKEVMEEVIAKSKMHKYERQKNKEDDEELTEKLNEGFSEIYNLLKGSARAVPPPKPPASAAVNGDGPVINADRQRLLDGMDRERADKEYDIRMKQLATDARAKPSNKTLTEEEKLLKEAQKLKALEEKRLKRMRGEDVSDDEAAPKETGAQLEGDDEEIPDQAEEFGFTNSLPRQKMERDVQPDEDEFDFDEDLIANDSDVELDGDQSDASDSEAAGPEENEEDEFVQEVLGAAAPTGANTSALGERRSGQDSSGLSYTYPCPRSHAELLEIVEDLPAEKLTTVIQRVRALYHPSLSASNKEGMADFSSALVEHLSWMAENKHPMAVIEQVIRHLHSLSRTYPTQIGEAFRKSLAAFHERGQPTSGDLVHLTAISSIYPTSDHWHQVVTPAITLMARWLALNVPTSSKIVEVADLSTGAFLVALCLKYQALSKRYIPEALRYTLRTLSTVAAKVISPGTAQLFAKFPQTLQPHLDNLSAMADLWKDKSAFIEMFTPALPVLKKLSSQPALTSLNFKTPHRNISILIQQSRTHRRPLELHHHKPQPIRTSVPKFEENFNPDKHYDPDRERSDANKLQKEYKRERKGAVRELRKDANFVAREQLKDKRERDAEYEKKYRKLVAEVQSEEGHENRAYERVKAKRQAEKNKKKANS